MRVQIPPPTPSESKGGPSGPPFLRLRSLKRKRSVYRSAVCFAFRKHETARFLPAARPGCFARAPSARRAFSASAVHSPAPRTPRTRGFARSGRAGSDCPEIFRKSTCIYRRVRIIYSIVASSTSLERREWAVSSGGEHYLDTVGVTSSNLVSPTIRGHGSVGRAQPCQGWGRGFEPRCPLHDCTGAFGRLLFYTSICSHDSSIA